MTARLGAEWGVSVARLALLAAIAVPAWAQPPAAGAVPDGERPAIGLALSGGGARGGAHIGVLKAMEELRVPIDYIAGTSIGAVVGGFYASGRTVAELEDLIENVDWESAFLNITPREYRSFRRKRDDDSFLVKQRPGLNGGELELPIGFVQGQVIDLIISQYTLPAATIDDFDRLPIPFRAVAADIATGDEVVLDSGNLARAIRASMAVPAALTPVEIDNRLLVDGGVAMNLPVSVARDMGADVVIAVDIAAPLLTRESLRSVVDVTSQLTNLLTRQGVQRQRELLGDGDVLLSPRFSQDVGSTDFTRMAEAAASGYAIVMEQRERFAPYALSPEEYAEYIASRLDPTLEEPPIIDFVRLENLSTIDDSIIETRIREVVAGEPLELDTLERAIGQAYGLELFQNVRYEIVTEGEQTGLEIEVVPRSWGPNYLQLGMSFSSGGDSDALFGLAASYLRTGINDKGGEWRSTFVIGDEPRFTMDLYQPLGAAGLYFVEPTLTLQAYQFNVFEGENLVSEARLREAELEVGVGRELLSWGEIRAGVRRATGTTRLRVGDPEPIPPREYDNGELFARFSVDTMDSVAFPRFGMLSSVEWRGSRPGALSADYEFDQVLFDFAFAKTWGRHTLLSTLRYDATISGTAPLNRSFRIGGFLDLSGLNSNQLTGQHAARFGLNYYRRIGDLALFPAFAGLSLEMGNAWDDRTEVDFDTAILGGSLWTGVDTPIGPVYVAYGLAEGDVDAFYIYLGRAF